MFVGQLEEIEPECHFYELLPYDSSSLGVLATNGVFIVVHVRGGKLSFVKKLSFGSRVLKYLPITTASTGPRTSFYVITDVVMSDFKSSLGGILLSKIHDGTLSRTEPLSKSWMGNFVIASHFPIFTSHKSFVFVFWSRKPTMWLS